ncbi:hypothetical protein CL614_03290 [archaeon]|nr:hypothetical protein [archaeon]|tara:strand:+ start:2087 stop:2314 length:228 start_codon:yes stop_codon:yes gene_type:complete
MADNDVAYSVECQIFGHPIRPGITKRMDAPTALSVFETLNKTGNPLKIYRGTWISGSMLSSREEIKEAELRRAAQ